MSDFNAFKAAICSFKNVEELTRLVKIANVSEFDFEGFDAMFLAEQIFKKVGANYQRIAEAAAVGYLRGNIHEASLNRTSDAGKTRIRTLATEFGIEILAKGRKRVIDRKTISFTRITAVFPQVVGNLLHMGRDAGGMDARAIIDRGYGVNELPSAMRFLHFISCASGVNEEQRKIIVAASAAWVECFLFQIVPDKTTVTVDMVSRQLTTMSSHVLISKDVSRMLLSDWGIVVAGSVAPSVKAVAEAYVNKSKK